MSAEVDAKTVSCSALGSVYWDFIEILKPYHSVYLFIII